MSKQRDYTPPEWATEEQLDIMDELEYLARRADALGKRIGKTILVSGNTSDGTYSTSTLDDFDREYLFIHYPAGYDESTPYDYNLRKIQGKHVEEEKEEESC